MKMMVNGKEVKWEDAPKGWFPVSGVKMHVLWRDEKTGANITLFRAPKGKGWDSPHSHPNVNEVSIGISGEMETPDGTNWKFSADNLMLSHSPKGTTHGTAGGKVIQEATWIRYQDGAGTRVNK